MEIWKQINEDYDVSSYGRVRSNKYNKTKILKPVIIGHGYLLVQLRINNMYKKCLIHRLVAKAFLPDYSEDLQVNHKDENKLNNNAENLEMCTCQYNNEYSFGKKVLQYSSDGQLVNTYKSARSAARINNYSSSSIINCCNGKLCKAYNYIWRYE